MTPLNLPDPAAQLRTVLARIQAARDAAIAPGLQIYVGVGWQFKNTKIQYDYTYSERNDGNPDAFGRFDRVRTTMGPQAVAGIEYAHFGLPISAFMELEYFSDVMADPRCSTGPAGIAQHVL